MSVIDFNALTTAELRVLLVRVEHEMDLRRFRAIEKAMRSNNNPQIKERFKQLQMVLDNQYRDQEAIEGYLTYLEVVLNVEF